MINQFIEDVKREQERILKLTNLAEENWTPNDQGILLLERRNNSTYCFRKTNSPGQPPKKHYIGTLHSDAAKEFVRQRFLREKHSRLIADSAILDDVMQKYQDYGFEAVFEALPNTYREVTIEDFNNARYEEAKRWANADYPVNDAPFPDQEIYTLRGLRVRSKGECIHANIYDSHGIPFRYDSAMKFTNEYGETRLYYPDFVIQCLDRRLILVEHLGRLFDKGYALRFGEKCHWYLQAGFVLGVDFFVTSDDLHGGTDSRAIEAVAKAIERLFYGF